MRIEMKQLESIDKLQRAVTPLVLCALLCFCALTVWNCRKPKPEAPVQEKQKQLHRLKKGPLRIVVRASGRIEGAASVQVKPRAAGTVLEVHVDLGDEVAKGDPLITLDSTEAAREVQLTQARVDFEAARHEQANQRMLQLERDNERAMTEAEAAVKSLEGQVADSQQKLQEKQALLEQQKLEQAEVDVAAKILSDAQKELTAARIRLRELKDSNYDLELARKERDLAAARLAEQKILHDAAQSRLKDMQILSPVDGVVTAKHVEPGQVVASGLTNGESPALVVVSDLSRLFVDALVDEEHIGHLSENLSAKISVAAFADRQFLGRIVSIAPVAATPGDTGGRVQFTVRIEIEDEAKSALRPGMTATAEVTAIEKADVLLLPVNALIAENGKTAVERMTGVVQSERKEVRIGMKNDLWCEVLSGLDEGDEVVMQTTVKTQANP